MKKTTCLSLLALAAAGLLMVTTTTQAATDGPHVTTTPIPFTLTDWTSSLSFPQFNPALGTLTSVQLDLSATFNTVLTIQNTSLSGSSGTAKTEVQLTVQDAGNNLIAPELDLLGPVFSYSLAPGGSVTSPTLTKSGTSSDIYTLAAILAEFTGAGSISLNASTFTQTLLANTGGNTAATQTTDASLTGSVLYTYTPVPEPSILTLAGLSAATLLLRKRRA